MVEGTPPQMAQGIHVLLAVKAGDSAAQAVSIAPCCPVA